MKGRKFKEYQVEASPDELRQKINDYVREERLNLKGEVSGHGRIRLWNKIRFVTSRGFKGPMVKLELSLQPSGLHENRTILSASRINGSSFQFQFWFVLVMALGTLALAIYKSIDSDVEKYCRDKQITETDV